MHRHLRNYRWDVRGRCSKSMEPMAEAERETPELVEGLVEAIEDLYAKLGKRQQQGKGRRRSATTTSSARPAGRHQAGDRQVPTRRSPQAANHRDQR